MLLREQEDDDLFATVAFGGALLAVVAGRRDDQHGRSTALGLRTESGQLTPACSGLLRAQRDSRRCAHQDRADPGGVVAEHVGAPARWLAPLLALHAVAFVTPLAQFLLEPAVLLLAAVSARLLRARLSRSMAH
jgi:hypothetical protein